MSKSEMLMNGSCELLLEPIPCIAHFWQIESGHTLLPLGVSDRRNANHIAK